MRDSLNAMNDLAIARCIGCGCDDLHACVHPDRGEPCSWLAVDRVSGLGVCSACPGDLTRWLAGDRSELALAGKISTTAAVTGNARRPRYQ